MYLGPIQSPDNKKVKRVALNINYGELFTSENKYRKFRIFLSHEVNILIIAYLTSMGYKVLLY